jgi:hypothetical protein
MTSKFQKMIADEAPIAAAPARKQARDESPRERAARRAAELREHSDTGSDGVDDFAIPKNAEPDGWTYGWKTKSVYGMENPAYQIQLAQEGWEPVPASRHPEMMPLNSTMATIERGGMILMECPTEIVNDRRSADIRRARNQVRVKEQQLSTAPAGQFERDHDRVAPKIKKSFEAMPVPGDDE